MAAEAARPNVVLMLSDDMGWEQVGYNGGTEVPTPNIDRIAREGVRLTQFYVHSVCSPTRGSLMTGRYPWKCGMEERPTASSQHGMLLDERTLAETLRSAGYATWMIGKWHLGEWRSEHLPLARGFDHHYGHYGALIDCFTHCRDTVLDWHRNGVPMVEEGYSTFLFAAEAEKLIAEHDGTRPFFLYLPFNAVHGPHDAPREFLEKYRGRLSNPGLEKQRAQLDCMDVAIGRVLAALEKKGIERETLVIFTNDNGGPANAPNGPYRGGKTSFFEGGVRVPCCMRWPGEIEAGTSADAMLHIVDFYPTIANLCGAKLDQPLPVDGLDAWRAISAGGETPHEQIVHSLSVIRRGDWKLIDEGATYYGWERQPLQLYDIAHDPSETKNMAGEHPEIVADLKARLVAERRLAREAEPLTRIPGYPPEVYGERENAEYGASLKQRLDKIRAKSPPPRRSAAPKAAGSASESRD